MASKNTDIIEQLADTMVANLTTPIAKRGKETAPNDKTFATVICGVNQKFTDDISDEEKNNTINKYSIPESIDDGENSYYTFKIDGAIYCKRQNGNFKLYDKVMVYIPNGDWSNMYFDYPDASSHGGNGGGGGSGNEHQLIVSVEAPGGANPKLGDMWLFVNSEDKTVFEELTKADFDSIYTWQEDENTNVRSWLPAKCTITKHEAMPLSNGRKGDLWIRQIEDGDTFEKLYLCTSGSGSGQTTWSEVYPDDETGEDYNLYISADKPLSEGDYWVQIDSKVTKNILSFSKYQFDEDNNKFLWKLLYNAGAGGNETFVSVDAPTPISDGCFLVTMPDTSTVTNLARYENGRWVNVNFQYGTTPFAPVPDTYYCIVAEGALRYILDGNNSWENISPIPYPFFINEAPDITIKPGDYWIKITDEVFRIAQVSYRYIDETWVEQYKFGATLGNGLEYDTDGKLQAKLGEGLTFDSNGAITMAYDPVINIEHALVYKR